MMQSVALTELNCNDDEFVIVEAPRGLTESNVFGGSSHTLSSLADDDDASYDYCDDGYSMPPTGSSHWEETFATTGRDINEEFNLPPNLTDTDVEDAIDYLQTEKFPSLELSDTKMMKQPFQSSFCLSLDGATACTILEMNGDRASYSSLPSSVSEETKDDASTATEDESATRLPSSLSAAGSGASSVSTLTRLSNKKRRKQVLLAKKAAAAAAAAAKLAEVSANEISHPSPTASNTKKISSLHKKTKKSALGRSKSKKLRNFS
ncbi:hypothetical protein FisN_21Hu080 [Fistulifera solaris]|uniref:Uncharacterized protein n=1 Tax=Fistulifera solaris TaxID=1519565 RepID=A0A1Z5KAF0_FISSO|nr:hypothetical protein FisN_21Hu080 [Fistulifera solaris]|eukprot:GAX23237.1 hypothetical protein FisN_21Hu080 [Fistulifera solaris]